MEATINGNGKMAFITPNNKEYLILPKKYWKKGQCEVCLRKVEEGTIKNTSMHHLAYDETNMIKWTIELCHRCHMHYHSLQGAYGDQHRDNIKKICETKWGKIPDDKLFKPKALRTIRIDQYKTGQDALTKTEYEKLLSVIDNFQDELMIRLTVATGMRREDVVNVMIKDIDFTNKRMSFYEHKKRKIHSVPLPDSILILIERYLKTIPKNQDKLFDICSKSAYNHFQAYLKAGNLRQRPFHALRATCIKFCQSAGWTPTQTAALVDDTLRVIEEHYKAPSLAEMQQVAQEKGFA